MSDDYASTRQTWWSERKKEWMQELVIEHLLEVLNRAVEKDPEAVRQLLEHRVPCNQALADDPTIQVCLHTETEERFTLGALGLLSGIAGTHEDGYSRIAAEYNLECPSCKQEILNGQTVGEPCNVCGTHVVLGRLRGFVRT